MKILNFYIIFIFFLASCHHTYVIREITYKVECKNCGRSTDGYVSIDINSLNKQIDPTNPLVLVITNHTSDVILLNLKLFTISVDNYVIYNPIGINNPNTSYSWTSARGYTFTSGSETPYYYSPLYNTIRRYSGYVSGSSYSSYSETTSPSDIGVIPANSIINYPIQDYFDDLYDRYVSNHKYDANLYRKSYWEYVGNYIYSFRNNSLVVTIVYKQLNEASWRTASVKYNCDDIDFYDI